MLRHPPLFLRLIQTSNANGLHLSTWIDQRSLQQRDAADRSLNLPFELPADPAVACHGRFLLNVRWERWLHCSYLDSLALYRAFECLSFNVVLHCIH